MEVNITGDPVIDNLKNHRELVGAKIRDLAYQRLQLMRQVEEIDKGLAELEGAQAANEMVQKDIDLRETIAQAQKEADEKKAAEKVTKKEV
jgi:hypothetical protein